jgi:hypothetical protein
MLPIGLSTLVDDRYEPIAVSFQLATHWVVASHNHGLSPRIPVFADQVISGAKHFLASRAMPEFRPNVEPVDLDAGPFVEADEIANLKDHVPDGVLPLIRHENHRAVVEQAFLRLVGKPSCLIRGGQR